MLDVIYLAATLALFAIVALVAKGVDRLAPRARVTPRSDTDHGGAQA